MKLTWIECSILIRKTVIVLYLFLSGVFMQRQVNAQAPAASVAVRQAAKANDGLVSHGEFNWEYVYIRTYTGGGAFYGRYQNPFFRESSKGYRGPCLNISNCEVKLGNSPIVGKSAKNKLYSFLQERCSNNEFGIIKSDKLI